MKTLIAVLSALVLVACSKPSVSADITPVVPPVQATAPTVAPVSAQNDAAKSAALADLMGHKAVTPVKVAKKACGVKLAKVVSTRYPNIEVTYNSCRLLKGVANNTLASRVSEQADKNLM